MYTVFPQINVELKQMAICKKNRRTHYATTYTIDHGVSSRCKAHLDTSNASS